MIIPFGIQMTIIIHLQKPNDRGDEFDVQRKYKAVENARRLIMYLSMNIQCYN